MSLDPFFSLSALNPGVNSYNPADPSAPYAAAYLYSYGGFTSSSSRYSLESQHANDQLVIGMDPVADTDQTVTSNADSFYRRGAVLAYFTGVNVSTSNQYLLVFRLASKFGSPVAQFFIGSDFVRAEPLTASPHDDIAILLDVPGSGEYLYAFVRLAAAGSGNSHGFAFKGVDCYLL